MIFDIITLSPSMFISPFSEGVIKKALEKGVIELRTHNLREFATDKHKVTDDYPFGGGAGMVMKVEPIYNALKGIGALKSDIDRSCEEVILLTPQGEPFTQKIAAELAQKKRIVLLCGRYEGVDERVRKNFVTRQISIGDYVLSGGELPAMVIIDSVARLVKGVLGNEESHRHDSHSSSLLEHAHYTRPADFMGMKAPDVLISGDHKKIEEFRRSDCLARTLKARPDLINKDDLSKKDLEILSGIKEDE